MRSLNQVVTTLKRIAESQGQVKHVFYGDGDEWLDKLQSERGAYPAVWIGLNSTSMQQGMTVFDFTIAIADLSSVELEGHSDTVQIMGDLFADISHPSIEWFPQAERIEVEVHREKENENLLTGCSANISIGVIYEKSRCSIPAGYDTSGDIIFNSNMTRNYPYTVQAGEESGFSISDLENKTVIYSLRDGIGTPVITSGSPTVRELLYTAATGTFTPHADNPFVGGEHIDILYTN